MMRSLYAGVSGLRSHQTMMDAVGDNIANVNTPGYKASRVVFETALAQQLRGGSAAAPAGAAAATLGGINPQQHGLGVRVASVEAVNTQGPIQTTGRPTDLAIAGQGFFVVKLGDDTLYTRSGAFGWDDQGNLTDPSGALVQGWMAAPGGALATTNAPGNIRVDMDQTYVPAPAAPAPPATLRSVAVGADGTISGTFSNGLSQPLGRVAMADFTNPAGLVSAGSGHFRPSAASGAPDVGEAGEVGGTIAAGALEGSNVELAQEFTNLMIAQRGFQANSRIISTSDEMLQELVNLKR